MERRIPFPGHLVIFRSPFFFWWFLGSHTGHGRCDFWSLCALRSVIFLVLFCFYELIIIFLNIRFICVEILRICTCFSLFKWFGCDILCLLKCSIILEAEFAQCVDINVCISIEMVNALVFLY